MKKEGGECHADLVLTWIKQGQNLPLAFTWVGFLGGRNCPLDDQNTLHEKELLLSKFMYGKKWKDKNLYFLFVILSMGGRG